MIEGQHNLQTMPRPTTECAHGNPARNDPLALLISHDIKKRGHVTPLPEQKRIVAAEEELEALK